MAVGGVTDVLVDALLSFAERAASSFTSRAAGAIGLAASVLCPPDDLELMTPDGRRYTGVAVMHEGFVVALLAVETRRPRRRAHDYMDPDDWDFER